MNTEIGSDILFTKSLLDINEVIAIPTETVYGLAGNGLNAESISKIYAVKNRPNFNPLILHTYSIDELRKYVQAIPPKLEKIMVELMPGALTVLLPKSDIVPDIVSAGSPKVAIRIPNHPVTLELLRSLSYPLAAPSANHSGYVSPTKPMHVLEQLNGKIPYILDGGDCQIGLESTIIGIENDQIVIYRHGSIGSEELEAIIHEKIEVRIQHSKPETPGALKSHYATKTPLYLGNIDDLVAENRAKKLVIIRYSDQNIIEDCIQYVLTPKSNLAEAAQNLFSIMRQADAENADMIITELAPNYGIGLAINDRLMRAQYIHK